MDRIKKESFGFTFSPGDPCMLFKENALGVCIMLIIGKKEQIKDFASQIQKGIFSENTAQPCRLPGL